jgi:hypothetical protein
LEYNPSDEEHKEIMEYLLSEGAAILDGIDEDGEPVYMFDMEILEEVMPELHAVMQEDMDQVLVDLYQKGLIEVSYDENLNAIMSISEQGKVALAEAGFNLDED